MRRILCLIIAVAVLFSFAGLACQENAQQNPPVQTGENYEPFSFAVITDLHVGYGIPNYYPNYPAPIGADWKDGIQGIACSGAYSDSQAKTLENIVDQIIKVKDTYNTKFVVVLGDISDTAEASEFLIARQILNRLNDAGIAYIPLLGNHDTWPYTEPVQNFNPSDRTKHDTIDTYASGDKIFEDIFWGADNTKNIQLIKNLFGNSWEKSKNPVNDLAGVTHPVYLQNYGFVYQGITFIALDIAPRAKNGDLINGSAYPGDTFGSIATEHTQTLDFAKNYTKNHSSPRNKVILLSHYPLNERTMSKYVSGEGITTYDFAGHQHRNAGTGENKVVVTEDTGNVDLALTGTRTNKPIRIVQVSSDGQINYDTLLSKTTSTPTPFQFPTPDPIAESLRQWLKDNQYKLSDFGNFGYGLVLGSITKDNYVVFNNEVWGFANAFGGYSFLLRSSDYGKNWELKWKVGMLEDKKEPIGIIIKDSMHIYVHIKTLYSEGTLYTSDGGQNWTFEYGWNPESFN